MPGYQGCRNLLLVVLLLPTSFLPLHSVAQVGTGLPPHGSFVSRQIDTVNLANLNVHVSIPLLQIESRGYRVWYELSCDSNFYITDGNFSESYPAMPGGGCMVSRRTSKPTDRVEYMVVPSLCDPSNPAGPHRYSYSGFVSIDNNNTYHVYNVATTDSTGCGGSTTTESGYALDGSGYYLTATGSSTSVTGLNGVSGGSDITDTPMDTNGNMITESFSGGVETLTDASGARWTEARSPVSQGNPYTYTITYQDSNGHSRSIVATWEPYTVEATPSDRGLPYGPIQDELLSSVVLPDGTAYQLTYESSPGYPGDVTGRLASITTPSGGVTSYQYTGGYNGFILDSPAIGDAYSVPNLTRTTSDGTTTYSRTVTADSSCAVDGATCETVETTIQNPEGSQTVVDFASSGLSRNLLETARKVYQGSATGGNLLLSSMRCYNGDTGNCTTSYIPSVAQDVSEIDETSTPTGAPASRRTTFYNVESLPTEVDEYDYGAASPSRVTTTSYAPLSNNIRNRPHQVTVYDGSGQTVQEIIYGYDEGTLTSTSGLSDHIAVSGSRGNLTSTHEWINSSGSTFDTTYTYDDAGSLLSMKDPNGTTLYGHDSSDTFVTSATPPTPTSGVSLPRSATYDPNTGLAASRTDTSGETTHYQYDWAGRPTQIQNPDGGVETLSYTPTRISDIRSMSSSENADRETILDGYGRRIRVAVANGQSGNPWYLVDFCYDANGRLSFRSYRYQGELNGPEVCTAAAGDTYSYDALGRLSEVHHGDGTSIKYEPTGRAVKVTNEAGDQKILQEDAFGRTTAVCEISSNGSMPGSGSPVNCGLDASGTGFLTTYAYDLADHTTTVTQGSQTRVFETDWLGRTIMTDEPETGTTHYYYGYLGTPGYGLQMTRTRAEANQTNPSVLTKTWTTYDAVGRVIGITYQNGDASPTLSLDRYFTYDTAVGWHNQNLGASKGRLTFAQTSGSAGEMFAYGPMGRVIKELECLPTQCGIGADDKWLDYSYDQAGNMTSATDGAGDTYTYTYSPAGEVQSISQSPSGATQPAALVSNVQNGPDGPISYQLGDGNGVFRTYDVMGQPQGEWVCPGAPNQGCGSAANVIQSYQLTWMGSQVTSSDEIETGNEQIYGYGYDEFGRLASMIDQTSVQQLYSWVYDRYGNRWQQNALQGGSQSSLSFNEADNQIDTAGFAYDAAGNLTQDPEHHYSYDAEGNVVQVDGGATATYTYGPLNQRVEMAVSGQAIGFLYNLAGQWASIWESGSQSDVAGAMNWDSMEALDSGGSSVFMYLNWQGTARAWTGPGVASPIGFTNLPFGDGSNLPSVIDETFWFAGMQMDAPAGTDSGIDHARFREYGNTEGRWMSPDPYAGSYDLATPQSLNRYSYVLNNPLGFTDPLGLDWTYDCGPNCVGVVGTDDGSDNCLWCWNAVGVGTIGPHPPPLPPTAYYVTTRVINPNAIAPSNFTCHDLAAGKTPSGSFSNWWAGYVNASSMLDNWLGGTGPADTTFGPNSPESQQMMGAYNLSANVAAFLAGGKPSGFQNFGLRGLLASGLNPTAHFVGSYGWSMSLSGGYLNITLTNATTMYSAFYHAPSFNPNQPTAGESVFGPPKSPMGRVNQTFLIQVPCS